MTSGIIKSSLSLTVLICLAGCATTSIDTEESFEKRMETRYANEVKAARDKGVKILIADFSTTSPNSANGVSVTGAYFPIADENNPIKYIVIDAIPFNAVGDAVRSSIAGKSRISLRITGPEYGSSYKPMRFANAWYNQSISCARIAAINIEMMDGTSYRYDGDLSDIVTERFSELKPCGGVPRNMAVDE